MLAELNRVWRSCRRSPLVSAAIVLSLGLGLGVCGVVFGFYDRLLRATPPVAGLDELVSVAAIDRQSPEQLRPVSFPNYLDLAAQSGALQGLAAYSWVRVGLADEGVPEEILGQFVSPDFFTVLGVRPQPGRAFGVESGSEVVLSHRLWQRRYAGASETVGRQVRLNGHPFTVVGVAPEGFSGPDLTTAYDLWVATSASTPILGSEAFVENRHWSIYQLIGRLAPGQEIGEAAAELDLLAAGLEREYPDDNRRFGLVLEPLARTALPAAQRSTLEATGRWMLAIGALVLLATGANLLGLLVGRWRDRRRDREIRQALGATRGRLIRGHLAESLLLGGLAAVAGLVVAVLAARALWRWRPMALEGSAVGLGLDPGLVIFALLLATVVIVVSAALPVLFGTLFARRDRGLLAVALVLQLAVSATAMVYATFAARNLSAMERVPLGFDPAGLALLSLDASAVGLQRPDGEVLFRRVLETVREGGGVQSAALAQSRPLTAPIVYRQILPAEEPDESPRALTVMSNTVSEGYFATLGVPIVAGRPFEARDDADAGRVAVVNRRLAQQLWPDVAPATVVDRSLRFLGRPETLVVVGVSEDLRVTTVDEEPPPYLYFPLAQDYYPGLTLHVRGEAPPARLAEMVQELRPDLPLTAVRSADDQVADALRTVRLAALVLKLLAAVVLILAMVGIYAVANEAVRRRGFEIAMRKALGAGPVRLVLQILGRSFGIVLLGGLVGGLLAALVAPWAAENLPRADFGDAAPYWLALALLVTASLVAMSVPIVRALRLDPMTLLRAE
ncbi:MAG: ABC transporter permease [Acidobacteriota bacterium]